MPTAAPKAAKNSLLKSLKKLRYRKDYLVAQAGVRAPSPGFLLLVHNRDDGQIDTRVGFTVTKKIGNAVVRNRLKRRLRALARLSLNDISLAGADVVLVGRPAGLTRRFGHMQADVEKSLERLKHARR